VGLCWTCAEMMMLETMRMCIAFLHVILYMLARPEQIQWLVNMYSTQSHALVRSAAWYTCSL